MKIIKTISTLAILIALALSPGPEENFIFYLPTLIIAIILIIFIWRKKEQTESK